MIQVITPLCKSKFKCTFWRNQAYCSQRIKSSIDRVFIVIISRYCMCSNIIICPNHLI